MSTPATAMTLSSAIAADPHFTKGQCPADGGRTARSAGTSDDSGGLLEAGYGPGRTIGLMMSSRAEFIVLQQAAFAVGGVVVPIIRSCDIEWRSRRTGKILRRDLR